MFRNSIKATIIAVSLGLAGLAAQSGVASAHHKHGGIYIGSGGFHIGIGDYYGHSRRHHRDYRRHRVCRPGKALRKAQRLGVRRAYVARVGRRGVLIGGRKFGRHVIVGFGKRRHCPVRFIDRV